MLTAFLAGSGRPVAIPDAVGVVEGKQPDEVHFVDAGGRTLVIFKRSDVSLFTPDGGDLDALHSANAAERLMVEQASTDGH